MTEPLPPDARPAVHVTVLSPTSIVAGATRTEVTSPRVRALLTALALARGRTVSAERLTGTLWPDAAPQSPRAALHTVVSRARSLCAQEIVVSEPFGYRLVAPSDLDLVEAAARSARECLAAGRPDEALRLVDEGRALYGSPVTSGAEVDDALREVRGDLQVTLDRAALEACTALGALPEAVRLAESLSARHPSDEDLHLTLMRCYDALGSTNDALRVFSRVRDAIADELGTTPGPALVTLNTELLRRSATPPATPPTHRPRSIGLRSSTSAMIGRQDEVDDLLERVRTSRLVTILGPGGLGKTRTAHEVARRADDAGRRVVVVELASIRTDDDVELALASALGVREEAGGRRISDRLGHADTSTRIADRLGEEPTLLVLDNCEHVVEGAARWTAELLAAVPSLVVLTTSRAPILVTGEEVVRLAPLSTVAAQPGSGAGPAVELFETRARAVRPDVLLPREAVARLCERLDGLPLAIELAAARVSSMTVDEIGRRLGSRFDLLTGGGRSAPARHRTLEAVIAWSWELLSPDERALLRRVSVFPSGFSAVAAQTVASLREAVAEDDGQGPHGPEPSIQTLDLLSGLVGQSLLTLHEDSASGTARFRMLETVREFGALRLEEADESAAVQRAFFVWAVEHCEREWPLLTGGGQVAALGRARREQENLLYVLRTASAEGRGDVVLAVFGMLGLFWMLSGAHSDVAASAPEALAASAATPVARERAGTAALALLVALTVASPTADEARRRLRDVLDSGAPVPAAVRELGEVVLETVTLAAAGPALASARRSDDVFVGVVACVVSAQLAENAGDPESARAHALAGYHLAVAGHETWGAASAAMLLGQLASQQATPGEALEWFAIAREGLLRLEAAADLDQLSWLEASNLVALDRVEEAEVLFAGLAAARHDTARTSSQDAHDARAVGLSGQAEIAYRTGDVDSALDLYESARSHLRGTASSRSPWFLLFGSSIVCLALLGGAHDRALREAPSLRARTLAQHRLSPRFTDHPILGTTCLALGAFLTHERSLGRSDDGLLLLAAAARLGSRQDAPSLLRSPHEEAARQRCGEAALWAAQERVAAVPHEDLVGLVMGTLRRGPWEMDGRGVR